jgi:hypothetical protein
MEDLSLHILDIVENSTMAGATLIEIVINENREKGLLEIIIRDNGPGMNKEMVDKVTDPFVTTRTTRRVGLGLSFFKQSAEEAGGHFDIQSEQGRGTEVKASFQTGHIDRKPLGDIGSTMISLILGNPEIDFVYESNLDGNEIEFDTREIREELGGSITITDPAVLDLIKGLFEE